MVLAPFNEAFRAHTGSFILEFERSGMAIQDRMRSGSGIGGGKARRLLLTYNEADCVNLQPLADRFYCELVQAVGLYDTGMAPLIEAPRALV